MGAIDSDGRAAGGLTRARLRTEAERPDAGPSLRRPIAPAQSRLHARRHRDARPRHRREHRRLQPGARRPVPRAPLPGAGAARRAQRELPGPGLPDDGGLAAELPGLEGAEPELLLAWAPTRPTDLALSEGGEPERLRAHRGDRGLLRDPRRRARRRAGSSRRTSSSPAATASPSSATASGSGDSGATPRSSGRTVRLEGEPYRVAGVMPAAIPLPGGRARRLGAADASRRTSRTQRGAHYLDGRSAA